MIRLSKDTIYTKELERLSNILTKEMHEIRHVEDWARKANCSSKTVNRVIQHTFGITAKQKLTEVRFLKIQEELKVSPQNKCFVIALNVGLKNEKELYKFLSRNFSTTISILRLNYKNIQIKN